MTTRASMPLLLACALLLGAPMGFAQGPAPPAGDLPPSRAAEPAAATSRASSGLSLRDLGDVIVMPHSGTQSIMVFDGQTGDLIDDAFIVFTEHSGVPVQAIQNFDRGGIFVSVQAGTTGNAVYEYDLDGNFLGLFAPAGGQDLDVLQNIRGIRLDPTGTRLWVTVGGGANGGAIAEFDQQGNHLGNFVDPGGSPMGRPWSILVRDDDVLVTDEVEDGVHRFDLDGSYLGLWNQATLNNPHQIAAAANDNVLVAGFSVPSGAFEFQPDGSLLAHYTARPSLRGITELPNGNLLVSSATGVFEITRDDELVRTIVTGQARQLTRIEARTISFTPSTLLGDVVEGQTSTASFTMHNNATADVDYEFVELPAFVSEITPSAGSLAAKSSVEVVVTFDGTAVPGGVHQGTIVVETDEPQNGTYPYPVVLTVIGDHGCAVTPDPIDFGEVIVGFDATLEAVVVNQGTGPCHITGASTEHGDFAVAVETPLVLEPDQSASFMVTFEPSAAGTADATLTLAVDDGADVTAALSGTGMAPPVATVAPHAVSLVISADQPSAAVGVSLSNEAEPGAADLEFTVSMVLHRAGRAAVAAAQESAIRAPARRQAEATGALARHRLADGDGPFPQTSADRGDGTELILDGSFEAGSPNPYWEEFSSNFGTPLCTIPGCAPFNPEFNPHTGDWWTWFGGHNTEEEFGYVAQEVIIPAGPAELSFFLQIPTANGTGYMRTMVDDVVIFEVTEAHAAAYPEYTQVVLDVSAFADETARVVRFESTTFPPGVTNFFLDDVSLVSTGPGLLAVEPMAGSVAPGQTADIELTATFDDALELGAYPYELRIHTNDPATPLLVVDVTVLVQPVSAEGAPGTPAFALEPNYPNPFGERTTIAYVLPEPAEVRLEVLDVTGRVVAALVDGLQPAGRHEATWDASGVASGVYFYRIQAGSSTRTQRAVIVR